MAVLIAVTGGLTQVGSAVVARHRAQAAADLAALAAAAQIASGARSACAQATLVARAMHTTMTDCATDGLEVVVHVEAEAGLGGWRFGPAHAAARGGPVLTGTGAQPPSAVGNRITAVVARSASQVTMPASSSPGTPASPHRRPASRAGRAR
ncbi:MAG: Rv3654c family TadE-like protein [Actinomycetota bacterium]|nr:Rv3654c family TadE-like protein [Actinomycetota bacterium]